MRSCYSIKIRIDKYSCSHYVIKIHINTKYVYCVLKDCNVKIIQDQIGIESTCTNDTMSQYLFSFCNII